MNIEKIAEATTDRIEQALLHGEAMIARVRAFQLRLLTELDRRQVPLVDGARSLRE
jgi:hypothetical protein